MKRKIEYLFGFENEYEGSVAFNPEIFENFVPKILDNLLTIPEVSKNTCFFGFDFKTLSFDILFVDDVKIREINREYRDKDKATDVITFALFADDDFKPVLDGDINLGEILISVDTARKQSKDGDNAFCDEILTLICHGILHLFGFDHQTEEDYNFIVGIQNRVLQAVCGE